MVNLEPGVLAGDDIIRLLRHRTCDLGAKTFRHRLGFVAGELGQRAREHHGLVGDRRALARLFGGLDLDLTQEFAERLDIAQIGFFFPAFEGYTGYLNIRGYWDVVTENRPTTQTAMVTLSFAPSAPEKPTTPRGPKPLK